MSPFWTATHFWLPLAWHTVWPCIDRCPLRCFWNGTGLWIPSGERSMLGLTNRCPWLLFSHNCTKPITDIPRDRGLFWSHEAWLWCHFTPQNSQVSLLNTRLEWNAGIHAFMERWDPHFKEWKKKRKEKKRKKKSPRTCWRFFGFVWLYLVAERNENLFMIDLLISSPLLLVV